MDEKFDQKVDDAFRIVSDYLKRVLATPRLREALAAKTEIPVPTLKDYARGRTVPPVDRFLRIAVAAGLDAAHVFAPLDGQAAVTATPGVVLIPRMELAAAAGNGTLVDVEPIAGELPFPLEFAEKIAPPGARLECLRCKGDSMEPSITDGALLIVDRRQTHVPAFRSPLMKTTRRQPESGIYVFEQFGMLRIKRLRDAGDGILAIMSDNSDIHPIEFHTGGRSQPLRIIGRVVWWDNRL